MILLIVLSLISLAIGVLIGYQLAVSLDTPDWLP